MRLIDRLFDEALQNDHEFAHRYYTDAEFHAKVRQFRLALDLAYLSLAHDEVNGREEIIKVLFEGIHND